MDLQPKDPDRSVSLPADHAFVIQVRSGSGASPEGPWTGRVEHVVSGRAARFEDCDSLRDFIVKTLHEQAAMLERGAQRDTNADSAETRL